MAKSEVLTMVIPVKNPLDINSFINGNKSCLEKYRVVVIDSGGGESLERYADIYVVEEVSMTMARKLGYIFAGTPYILNLDVDDILPNGYIENALFILRDENVVVVAIDYEECLGHYGFGTSLWKANILKKLYDYREGNILCECVYMWRKVLQSGHKMESLPYRAKHLRG